MIRDVPVLASRTTRASSLLRLVDKIYVCFVEKLFKRCYNALKRFIRTTLMENEPTRTWCRHFMANTEIKSRKNRSESKPFYLASGTTSAEIVAEARTSVRCVDTKRPCTPVESQRTLFGASRRPESHSRPPSAFRLEFMICFILMFYCGKIF